MLIIVKEVFIIESKTVQQSKIVIGSIMELEQANIHGNVHGGEIMKIMDNAAGIVSMKHARANVVTARVDRLEFHLPIHIGSFVNCIGEITFVGNSSMEVLVTVMVEDLKKDDAPKIALTGYFSTVALDRNGRPKVVPKLEITNDEERRLFEEGEKRYMEYRESKRN